MRNGRKRERVKERVKEKEKGKVKEREMRRTAIWPQKGASS